MFQSEKLQSKNVIIGSGFEQKLEVIKKDGLKKLHILTDFDRTITESGNMTSAKVLSETGLLPPEYKVKRDALFEKYHPIEIDPSLDDEYKSRMMLEWWQEHFKLFDEFELKEDYFEKAFDLAKFYVFRKGAENLLKIFNELGLPVIIISSGFGNFIRVGLKRYKCGYSNIKIISNFFKFDQNGNYQGLAGDIIHVFNKDEKDLPEDIKKELLPRPNVILLGDSLGDIKMANMKGLENIFKIGFLDRNIEENKKFFEKNFDLILINDQSMDLVIEIIEYLK